MAGHVSIAASFFVDTIDWPRDAQWLFLWLWLNEHANGITGIGEVSDTVAVFETKLSRKKFEAAKAFLSERGSVAFSEGWYWVRARGKHTLFTTDGGANGNMVRGAASVLSQPGIPPEIVEAFCNQYGKCFDAVRVWPEGIGMGSVGDGEALPRGSVGGGDG